MCNMLQLTFICVMNFSFILLPTGSPLPKVGQFWPLLPSPDQTKCFLSAKRSLQHSIYILRKSKKKLATFPIKFFSGNHKSMIGGAPRAPPPASNGVNLLSHSSLFQYGGGGAGIDKSLDLEKSREEMTPYFLARSRKLDFHFSFYSRFSRFLEKNSTSLLDLWDFYSHSLSILDFQDF